MYRIVSQFSDGTRNSIAQIYIKESGSGPNAGAVFYTKWLLYMLKAVEVTANITYYKINDIISAKDAILEAIVEDNEISRPESLIDVLFTQPYTKVRHLTDRKLFSENTALKYPDKLSDMGILEKRIVQGNSYYLNLELYRILSE